PVTVAAAASVPSNPSDETAEDVQNHLRHIQEAVVRMLDNTKRIERRLDQVSPSLQQNYLALEKQRLDVANQLSQSVLQDAAVVLEETELAKQNLTKRRQ